MRWRRIHISDLVSEKQFEVAKSMLGGAAKGSAAGAATCLFTGAAVIVTAPAWIPFVGGTMAVSTSTLAAWAAGGAAVGAVTQGARKYLKVKKTEDDYKKCFGK